MQCPCPYHAGVRQNRAKLGDVFNMSQQIGVGWHIFKDNGRTAIWRMADRHIDIIAIGDICRFYHKVFVMLYDK